MHASRSAFASLVLAPLIASQERALFDQPAIEHLVALSSSGFEAKPDIAADRLTLYFASDQAGGAGDLDLWRATRPSLTAPFGVQTNITELNGAGRDHTPTTSADGLLMIYSSSRAGGLGTDDAWFTTRASTSAPWNPPTNIPEISSSVRDMGFSMTPDGLTLYWTSNQGAFGGDFELYTSTRPDRSAAWSPPQPITELNTPWNDKFPSVTGDNLTMYFASDRPGSVPNALGAPSLDLWVAMRPTTSSPWTIVENVFEVNTADSEYLMSIADDGEELFFVSDRPGSLGLFDLYRVPAIPGVRRYGAGTDGEAGVPRLRPVGGPPQIGNPNWGYEITQVSPQAFGFYIHSTGRAPGPLLVNLSALTVIPFQGPSPLNPPAATPRLIPSPLPASPALIGFTSHWQAIMAWDLRGRGTIAGVPFAASPAIAITFF
ncbi:MAG: hypothetical protein AAF628_00015 [Planctomycetota bacterium]